MSIRYESKKRSRREKKKENTFFLSIHLEYVVDIQKKSFEIYKQDKDSVCESKKDREKATHEHNNRKKNDF